MHPPQLPISTEPLPATHPDSHNVIEKRDFQKGKILAVASIAMASLGILPLVIFVLNCLDGPGLGLLICLVVGLVIHAVGSGLGFFALFYGRKVSGLTGLIGNAAILLISILFFLLGLAMHRY
jgi:hypothetical protein